MNDTKAASPYAGRLMLDARLCTAYDMVSPCKLCADIGADHGKLSAALLMDGRAEHMLVADISEKALAKARVLLAGRQLTGKATFAVADGLAALDALDGQKADVICALGMGGDTIADMLRKGAAKLNGALLVLGAQTELPVLREALCEIGYRLREECVAEATGRFYVVMRAEPAKAGEADYTEKELLLGPCLLKALPPAWEPILKRREALLIKAQAAMAQAVRQDAIGRQRAVAQELTYIQETLAALEEKHNRADESKV